MDSQPMAEWSAWVCDDDAVIALARTSASSRVSLDANDSQTCAEYVNAVMTVVTA